MARKKKKFEQSASYVGTSESFASHLRTLINGLFGDNPTYQPTRQEIAEYYLTPREREIAYLAAVGFSVQEIGDALGMNFQTVRVHLHHVLQKLQLDNVAELRDYFVER
jgi:DNA-binding NarL/FixJ family response regulator